MNHNITAMILAAGLGTRLQALTHDKPKALVELNGKPLLQHCIENLIANGFDHIVINVHHFGEQIIDFVEHHKFDADIEISDERNVLMDTGGGIIKATPLFKGSRAVLVHNVDIISNVDLQTLGAQFIDSKDDAWLLTQDRNSSRKLLFDDESQLVGWCNTTEGHFKWVLGSVNNYREMAFSGLHFFRSELFADFEVKPQSVIDLYLQLAKRNRILSKPIQPDFWFDLGKPEQLQTAESFLITRPCHSEDFEGTDTLTLQARYDMPSKSE